MKPTYEISKNVIIVILIAIIGAMGTYIVSDKIWPQNKENTVKNEFLFDTAQHSKLYSSGTFYTEVKPDTSRKIMMPLTYYYSKIDSISQLRKENAALKAEYKVYRDLLNKSQSEKIWFDCDPNFVFISDTLKEKYYQSKWSEDSDTLWYNDSTYVLQKQLPIIN
jgi:hypothetical protein